MRSAITFLFLVLVGRLSTWLIPTVPIIFEKKRLKGIRDELLDVSNRQIQIDTYLKSEHKALKEQYLAFVNDVADAKALLAPEAGWTEFDDILLKKWSDLKDSH